MAPNKYSKSRINLALKVAILRRSTQREISLAAGITEVKLSKIVNGADASPEERRALARALRVPQRELFPAAQGASVSEGSPE
jgi:transcriptional regulator with XRE-family HTH domain